MPRARVIRRQSTYQRISSYLNPFDFFLRLATDYEAFDWDNWQNTWGTPLGIVLNVFCMIARGQADKFRRAGVDDVFRRTSSSPSMAAGLSYFVCDAARDATVITDGVMACRPLALDSGLCSFFAFVGYQLWLSSYALALFSVANAVYCFARKKRYRLFEYNIENEPRTPSARRVPVDSSPISSSPLRVITSMNPFRNDAASRAHPDETRDVWEVGVWDPSPLSLHLFSIFSPVHVAIYFLSLPVASGPVHGSPILGYESSGTNSAAVYFTVILTQILLSVQLICLKSWFVQQAADFRIISKEVMHEYDQKYVHPRLNVIKRDVAVQCSMGLSTATSTSDVQVYTPNFNRSGFRTFANPNYAELTKQQPPVASPSTQLGGYRVGTPATPFPVPPVVRRPQFDRVNIGDNARRASVSVSSSFASTLPDEDADEDRRIRAVSRNRERQRYSGTGGYDQSVRRATQVEEPIPRRNEGYDQPRQRMGTEGLVDWSRNNSRGLSPSKGTPLKKGSSIRGSTYAESLGTPLGTPVRRRHF